MSADDCEIAELDRYLRYTEVAKLLSVSLDTVYRLVKNRKLPVTYVTPDAPRVPYRALKVWLKRASVPAIGSEDVA